VKRRARRPVKNGHENLRPRKPHAASNRPGRGLTTTEMRYFVKLWLGPAPLKSKRARTRIEFVEGLSRLGQHTVAALMRSTGRSNAAIAEDLDHVCATGALEIRNGRYVTTSRPDS
jgi:hypothetical protein